MHTRVDIKRNDQVKVITGRDKGKQGRVLRVFPGERKLLVEHVMMVKKNVRPNPQRNIKGGIAEQESPSAISNRMIVCPASCPSRVGHKEKVDPLANDRGQITGQKPVVTRAKKSIAAFKVREGMAIGAMVTLRGNRMYEFMDRLVNIALPRVRDFRGVSTKSFDGRGNYTLGLRDQLIFPEIDYAKVDKLKGMNVTIVTTARDDNQARALLKHLGMPFKEAIGK